MELLNDEMARRYLSFVVNANNSLIRDNFVNHKHIETNTTNNHKLAVAKPRTTFPFGNCKVCNDKATGIHYGIASCEACKGFFKRTLLKEEKYRCYFGNHCPITPENRNSCKSCRYNKCKQAGMSIQATRYGRIPNSIKGKLLSDQIYDQFEKTNERTMENCYSIECPSTSHSSSNSDQDDNDSSDTAQHQQQKQQEQKAASASVSQSNANKINGNDEIPISIEPSKRKLTNEENDINGSLLQNQIKNQISSLLPFNQHKLNKKIDDDDENETTKLNLNVNSIIKLNDKFISNLANIQIKRVHTSPILDMKFQMTLSFVGDKIYQTHIETNDRVAFYYRKACETIKHKGVVLFEGHQASMKDIWNGIFENIHFNVKSLLHFVKQLPGFLEQVNKHDLRVLIDDKLFLFFLIKYQPLYINGECFIHLEDGSNSIQYTRKILDRVVGEKMTQILFEFADEFNSLAMTTKEVALLIPYVITLPTESLDEPARVAELHEYYHQAILYEFDLTMRSKDFKTRWKKLIEKLIEVNNLYINTVVNMIPKF